MSIMNYVILGEPFPNAKPYYRGLRRNEPDYIEDLKIKKYWDWYIENFGNAEYLHESDRARAFELINAYKEHGINYELICIADDFQERGNDDFLGIDIATRGGYSILQEGLEHDFTKGEHGPLVGIHELLYLYFQPKLNEYLLFQEKDDADLFVKVVKEMQATSPGYFECEEFYPQYLYLVK